MAEEGDLMLVQLDSQSATEASHSIPVTRAIDIRRSGVAALVGKILPREW